MLILIGYGTRPEFIKIKPLLNKLKDTIPFKTVFTGQHLDIISSDYTPDYILKIPEGENRLDSVLSSSLNNNHIFENITHVLVQGDTTSALSLALSAFHRKLKIIHLEAGLRTNDFDNPFPEEMNRQLISKMSDINFCPTKHNKETLDKENVKGISYVVGNTGLDAIVDWKKCCETTNIILITLHRRENHEIIDKWFRELNKLAENNKQLRFIFPLHPNPNVQKYKHLLTHVEVIEPVSHDELLKILVKCKFVISDSGGIQEEACFLNKKVIVCRKKTERSESLEYTSWLCKEPKKLKENFNFMMDFDNGIYDLSETVCPFGDGKASEKIVKILKKYDKKSV
jgi:UDP-N-acetylglucosamine 2-epimerase (non-hydrolysing)